MRCHVVAPAAVGILRGATCERDLVVPFLLLYGASSQEPQSQRGWFTDWLHLLLYLEIPSPCSNMFQLCRSILLHSVPWKESPKWLCFHVLHLRTNKAVKNDRRNEQRRAPAAQVPTAYDRSGRCRQYRGPPRPDVASLRH